MKVLVMGATGMLGHICYVRLLQDPKLQVFGLVRRRQIPAYFKGKEREKLVAGIDVTVRGALDEVLRTINPNVIVNAVGIIKQNQSAQDPLLVVPVNTLLPHRLASWCQSSGARLVQISTDCVFSGKKGNYSEDDFPDCSDLYGRSKLLGETVGPNCVTLRTSIVGPEISSYTSLLEWFLAQNGTVKGFSHAIFSGLTTLELSNVIHDLIVRWFLLQGLYHVSAQAISKYELLRLVARAYGKDIRIEPDSEVVMDRSLNSERFRAATGYHAPPWPEMIQSMQDFGKMGRS